MIEANNKQHDVLFKVVLIGDDGVGKTCIFHRFTSGDFKLFSSTIGVDFGTTTVYIKSKQVNLQIWDTAGQDRFRELVLTYCRDADAVIFVFDLTQQISFENLGRWMRDVKENSKPNVVSLLIGSKSDMVESREVTEDEIAQFCKNACCLNVAEYVETSAKHCKNIDCVFEKIGTLLLEEMPSNKSSESKRCLVS